MSLCLGRQSQGQAGALRLAEGCIDISRGERWSQDKPTGSGVPSFALRLARCEGFSLLFLGLFEHLCRTTGQARRSGTNSARIWLQIPFKQEANLAEESFRADMEGDLGIGYRSPKRSGFPLHTPSNPR